MQDFGETPAYVVKRKEEMQRAQDEYDAYVSEHFRRGAMRKLTDEERLAIIQVEMRDEIFINFMK